MLARRSKRSRGSRTPSNHTIRHVSQQDTAGSCWRYINDYHQWLKISDNKSSEKTAICNTFDVLSHLLIFELGVGVCHAAGTNSGTSTRLSNSLMEVYTSSSSQSSLLSSPKSPHKTINLVLVFENRKNSSCSLLCPLYLELAHICPQQPGGELLGEIWEWVSRSLSVLLSRLSCSDSPSSPPKILAQTQPICTGQE